MKVFIIFEIKISFYIKSLGTHLLHFDWKLSDNIVIVLCFDRRSLGVSHGLWVSSYLVFDFWFFGNNDGGFADFSA